MRIRQIVRQEKRQESETDWRENDLQKRYAPFYSKTRPMPRGWKWKSATAVGNSSRYVLLALCNPARAKWQAFLGREIGEGFAVIARFEDHGSHQGVHIHTDCDRSGLTAGPSGLDKLSRIPSARSYHRRVQSWTEDGFWRAAKIFFRIEGSNNAEDTGRQGSLGL